MIKIREFKEHNYRGIWYNGKTMRLALDPKKPITELDYPEFYDVKITGHCEGCCPWCYMDSKTTDHHYDNIIQKIKDYFGPMSENERPFQVAIGGGEPTSHPDFIECLKTFKDLGIEPNYTTNGMWTKERDIVKNYRLINETKRYCGGVAVSCHPHLKKYWLPAADYYNDHNIKLNFHIIISDKDSIDYFRETYDIWKYNIDYFVLLPYEVQGRAEPSKIDWEYLIKNLPDNHNKLAFGANFYPYLISEDHGIKVSLYEPEIMSKFLDLKDMSLYPSSFNLNKIENANIR